MQRGDLSGSVHVEPCSDLISLVSDNKTIKFDSVDGEVPERIVRSWGAEVIRGSANQSGALALRDQQQMMKNGYSIVTTVDGPSGPKLEVKAGAILMARIAGVPLVPIACAADRA